MLDQMEDMTSPCGVIFDLDGTLIDSIGGIAAAVNRMLLSEGLAAMPQAEVQSYVGSGLPALVARVASARGIPAARRPALVARLEADYTSRPTGEDALYPGAVAALTALAETGHLLAICTNKPLRPTHAVLEGTGLRRFFRGVIGGDSLAVRKPDPAPLITAWRVLGTARAIYVGDSGVDAQTAEAAALPFVLFTQGYLNAPRESIREAAAFSDFRDLPGLISHFCAVS